jgi:hypothetical protein
MPKPKVRSWGVDIYGVPHSWDFCCENRKCEGWSILGASDEVVKRVVGFSLAINPPAVIYQCPKCFEYFWVHSSGEYHFKFLIKFCPNWPKKKRNLDKKPS